MIIVSDSHRFVSGAVRYGLSSGGLSYVPALLEVELEKLVVQLVVQLVVELVVELEVN